MAPGASTDADATGRFHDEMYETGWGRLYLQSPSVTANTAFAAGFLEGALTAHRIVTHLANYKTAQKLDPVPADLQTFVEATDTWIRGRLQNQNGKDPYWNTVKFQYEQMDGMMQGANAYVSKDQQLSRLDVLLLGLAGDLSDIKLAVNISEQAKFDNMTTDELMLWTQLRGHCSALVKLVPDGSELFIGHSMWWDYSVMTRIFKRYEFGDWPAVSMSSFPGILASMDDYYQMDKLVAIETTNSNYNNDLFKSVTPESLPYWIRAMSANYLATSGAEWMDTFKKYNSGTYNNMWMVVDYGKFTPGQPLPDGVLTVGEQLPGYFHYEDQTRVLSYGYWPSFNIGVYPETARLMQQDTMVKTKGTTFSYQENPRAQVFRRDQASVQNDADMQKIMRYNKFQTDPLAHGNPCWQLACRSDLGTVTEDSAGDSLKGSIHSTAAKGFGAIDAKYTSSAHMQTRSTIAISGPTHDDQAPFEWDSSALQVQKTPHAGQPNRFDFGWYIMMPEMNSRPVKWASESSSSPKLAMIVGFVGVILASTLVVQTVRVQSRKPQMTKDDVQDVAYHRMKWDKSPTTCSTSASSPHASLSSMQSPPPLANWNSP